MSTIGAVILASGESRRFGSNKLLSEFRGKPIVSYIIETISQSLTKNIVQQAVVVTRYADIRQFIKQSAMGIILHDLPHVNDTIRLGTAYYTGSMHGKRPDGIMFCVADQPLLTVKTIKKLCTTFNEHPEHIIRLVYIDPKTQQKCYGNPVIFPSNCFDLLCSLPLEQTGKYIIKQHPDIVLDVAIDTYDQLCDIDTVEQLHALID